MDCRLKLTDLERTVLFDALTLYKKINCPTLGRSEESEAVSSLRSKLKKMLAKLSEDGGEVLDQRIKEAAPKEQDRMCGCGIVHKPSERCGSY